MIGIFGDTQIYSKGQSSAYLQHTMESLDNIYSIFEKNEVKKIIHLGDVYEIKNEISDEVLVKTSRYFKKLSKLVGKDNFYIIVGNHDTTRKDNSINLLEVFSPIAKVIHKPYKEGDLTFIPYYRDENIIKNYLKNVDTPYLFGHFGINGARYQKDGFTSQTDLIVPLDFRKLKKAFLGHYHYHQTIGNVSFVGSPWQMNFGEEGEKKGIVLFDETNGDWEFVENNVGPQYHTVELNKTNFNKIKNKKGCFFNLLINKKMSPEAIFKFKDFLMKYNYDVKITNNYLKSNDKLGVVEGWNSITKKDTESIIKDFMDSKDPDELIYKEIKLNKDDLFDMIGIKHG